MFSTEVVRIAREIADGNLNVRAEVEAVEGKPIFSHANSPYFLLPKTNKWFVLRVLGVFLHIISEVNKMSGTLSSQVGTFQAIVSYTFPVVRFSRHIDKRKHELIHM